MAAAPEDPFFSSRAWLDLRYRVLKEHKGSCQACGAKGTPDNPIQVDHIKPRSKHPELALVSGNLQVLCKNCNFGKGTKDETDWRHVTSRRLVTLEASDPETRARFQQLTWLRFKGDTKEIRREAEKELDKLRGTISAAHHAKAARDQP